MFSGGDSSGEGANSRNQFCNQFRIASQSAMANGPSSGSIDWASLAQQWIKMRDNSGADIGESCGDVPHAPPPPNISGNYQTGIPPNKISTLSTKRITRFEEKGEADMDMDEEQDSIGRISKVPAASSSGVSIVQPQWTLHTQKPPISHILSEIGGGNSTWPPPVPLTGPTSSITVSNPTAHIPSLLKLNVANPNTLKSMPEVFEETNVNAVEIMDAAKRKILPAWIREGLEKMEREKQKQLDKQLSKESTEEQHNRWDDVQSNELTVNKQTANTLASDDSSGNEEDYEAVNNIDSSIAPLAKVNALKTLSDIDEDPDERNIGKSYEQRLADLMIVVRRTLTELLLEVTNEEIFHVANETIKSIKSKASSAQVIKKSALSSITGKLGLAAYDDSSNGESSSISDNDESSDNDNFADSEEEIKATIRTKRRAFTKTSEDIEERISAAVLHEEQTLKFYTQVEQQKQRELEEAENKSKAQQRDHDELSKDSNGRQATAKSASSGKGYERDFGETTESKLQNSNGKRQKERSKRKERTTRFSDNKDSKNASLTAAAIFNSQIQNTVKSGANVLQMVTGSGSVDPNSLYALPTSSSSYAANSGNINSILSAADVALEKASKSTSTSSSTEKGRRRRHSSDKNDSSSSDSQTTASNSSRNSSKYSRSSSYKRKDEYYKSSRYHGKPSSSNKNSRHERTSRDHYSHDRGSSSRHRRRHRSSDSDDDDYYRSSRHSLSSKKSSHRSKTRSRSPYSTSSRRRH